MLVLLFKRTKEENLMKEKMIASRIGIHKHTAEMVALRLPYEEMVSSKHCLLNLMNTNLIFSLYFRLNGHISM